MTETMELRVITPAREVLSAHARRIRAVGLDGAFGLLPRHLDIAAPLVAGVAVYEDEKGEERYVALDRGALLKLGGRVTIAVHRAVVGEDLHRLADLVEREFKSLSEHEREAQRALARLEAGFIRHLLELEERR